ncbi:hypothetical protein HK096_001684 [Nowakowskiella sp. JEL0078]|nr:hypothetical protein HK096_001684 [Nowakowskiella sp. JEL0078]
MGSKASPEEIKNVGNLTDNWEFILGMKPLKPGTPESRHNIFMISNEKRWTHIRVNMHPDGGISRLRVYGEVLVDWDSRDAKEIVDLVCVINGGKAIGCSDSHFGKPINLIAPSESIGMYDGWETSRNPNRPPIFKTGPDGKLELPGMHWTILKLGHPGMLSEIHVDTLHFKGNFPESCALEGCDAETDDLESLTGISNKKVKSRKTKKLKSADWFELVPRTILGPNEKRQFAVDEGKKVTHIRVSIYPDGGVSRIRALGKIII